MKIVHLVPYDGLGGVETAARSMASLPAGRLDFSVLYLSPSVRAGGPPPPLGPSVLIRALHNLLQHNPELWIASLWRSCIVGIAAKLLRPRGKFVLFLHSSQNVHFLDALVTRLAALLADEIWADSEASLAGRLPYNLARQGRVISFLVQRICALPSSKPGPHFIFWGRLTVEKQLDRAISIFSEIHRREPTARFCVIGPDCGELEHLISEARRHGVEGAVDFRGAMQFDEITRHAALASFYLQTSAFEGMALSVIEAMQLGLVPVVTPVGEIRRYCQHGENAVLIEDGEGAKEAIFRLLADPGAYDRVRSNAINTWSMKSLYREAVLSACSELLAATAGPNN